MGSRYLYFNKPSKWFLCPLTFKTTGLLCNSACVSTGRTLGYKRYPSEQLISIPHHLLILSYKVLFVCLFLYDSTLFHHFLHFITISFRTLRVRITYPFCVVLQVLHCVQTNLKCNALYPCTKISCFFSQGLEPDVFWTGSCQISL